MDLDLSDKNRSEETSQANSEKENDDSKSDKKHESGFSNDCKLVSSGFSRSKPVSSGFVEAPKKRRNRVVMEIDEHFATYGRARHSGFTLVVSNDLFSIFFMPFSYNGVYY